MALSFGCRPCPSHAELAIRLLATKLELDLEPAGAPKILDFCGALGMTAAPESRKLRPRNPE
jgi:hypothetical protein